MATIEKINTENLEEKLNTLRGIDFEAAETQERGAGNPAVEITFSKSFQTRIAALALGVNVHDLKALPLKKYLAITNQVSRFLFSTSAETDQPTNFEQSPQN